MHAYNLLANGSGGIDWAGLPLICEYLGITEIEPLIHAIGVIKSHEPETDRSGVPPITD